MTETAAVITLVAGSITFVNEWYQTRNIDWKVPVATLILAAGVDVVAKLDSTGANILSLLILLGAATTKYNNKSAINTISDLVANKSTSPPKGSVSQIPNR